MGRRDRNIRLMAFVVVLLAAGLMGQVGPSRLATATRATPDPNVADAADCPVTPYAAEVLDPSFSSSWFGSGDLWAAADNGDRGAWFADPQWMKVQWRRPIGVDLTVEGRRLDAPAAPLSAGVSDGYDLSSYTFTPMTFPAAGCWEVIGRIPGTELRFVVFVHPGEEHYRQSPPATPEPGLWETLRRPLIPLALARDGSCPRSLNHEISRVEGTVFGDGPIYIQGQDGTDTISLDTSESNAIPMRWISNPDAAGPYLIRGTAAGGGAVRFGSVDPQTEMQTFSLLNPDTPDWQLWSAPLSLPGPGCYALQIDGPASTQVIVLDVAA